MFAGWSTVTITGNLTAAALRSVTEWNGSSPKSARRSISFFLSTAKTQTSSIPKTKAAKQEESEKQTPETARPHHFLFDALQSLPEGWKTTTAISPWAVDYHLCWNKSTLPLWTQWDLRASGGDLPTRGAFNSIQKRRQSGYTNSARSNTAFGDWGWQWDNVDDLKESLEKIFMQAAIGDYQYTEFMEACIHKYIHMTFSVHSRQSVVAKRLCSKMY